MRVAENGPDARSESSAVRGQTAQSLQMGPNKNDIVQETQPLDLDVVAALERIVRRLGLGAGQVTLEAVFADGSYLRGFVKQGPINAQQMRALGPTTS